PDINLGDVFVPPLAAGAMTHVSASLPSASLGGRYVLRVVVNPDNVVAELDTTNNQASAPFNVRQENDLAVSASNIRFTPSGPNQVQVSVVINNYGATLPINVTTNVYKGNPSSGGTLIGSGVVNAGLAANQTASISVSWNTSGINGPTPVYVVIDPSNQLVEADKTNNIAFRFFYPGNPAPTDLAITSREFVVTPNRPVPNQPFTLTVPVHNLSNFDANRVQVAAFTFTGTPLGQLELSQVPALGTTIARFDLSMPRVDALVVVVDPQQLLQDPNRSNNTDTLGSFMSNGSVELTMQGLETSAIPPVGGQFTVTARVVNNGSDTANTSVRLVDQFDGSQP